MSYLSIEFSAVFLLFFIVYWCFKSRAEIQNVILVISSYCLVGLFNIDFALILASYSIVIYLLSSCISYSSHSKFWLVISLIVAIGNLAVFKYYNFFLPEIQKQFAEFGMTFSAPIAEILLPIGISFYTFHSVSYLVSLYKKEIEPVSFFDFALFLAFFPSVIAGPINRAKEFLPQIQAKTREIIEPHRAFTLIILAIIKVYWLSSVLSQSYVKPFFDNPSAYHTVELVAALYAYAIEIYLNFSGYTDLVTGIALLLGFKLPMNFNFPYLATNLREFWQRWHISLSTWIRDYVYFPLGGSRSGFTRTQVNVMIAMVLSGLWHGETLNFLIWGMIHGVGIICLNMGDKVLGKDLVSKHSPFVARLLMFNYICFGWLFFRSASFDDAKEYFNAMMTNISNIGSPLDAALFIGAFVVIYALYPLLAKLPEQFIKMIKQIHWTLLPLVFVLILWCVIYLAPSGIPQFIYASF